MTRPRLSLIFVALLVAGCTWFHGAPSPAATAPSTSSGAGHFDNDRLSFDYSARWNSASFLDPSSFYSLITFLSTVTLRDPCSTTSNETHCGPPIDALPADGVLVEWWAAGFPGHLWDPIGATQIEVGGLPGTLETTAVDMGITCDQAMRVKVPDPDAESHWTEMDACLVGPDLARSQAEIQAMLDSVTWTSSPMVSPTPIISADLTERLIIGGTGDTSTAILSP